MGLPVERVEQEDSLTDAVVQVLNAAVTLVGHCNLCLGTDDEHTHACPVPALEAWMDAQ